MNRKKLIWVLIIFIIFVLALVFVSDVSADGSVVWDGHGAKWLPCNNGAHWILSDVLGVTDAYIIVNGVKYDMTKTGQGGGTAYHANSVEPLSADPLPFVEAFYYGQQEGIPQIQLSHCLEDPDTPTPTFTKTPVNTKTSTPTNTETSTATNTATSTATSTATPTNTKVPPVTFTPKPTNTATATLRLSATPTETGVSTATPTNTEEPTVTSTPVYGENPTPTPTSTRAQLEFSPTPTTPGNQPTETPKPPKPAVAQMRNGNYPGAYYGNMVLNGETYGLYNGEKGQNGELLLPEDGKSGAVYQNTIWIHRMSGNGWLNFRIGSTVLINGKTYRIMSYQFMNYGEYPQMTRTRNMEYIASCYSDDSGNWAGVQVFRLRLERFARWMQWKYYK